MPAQAAGIIILGMTRPPISSRVLLLTDRRQGEPKAPGAPVRRFRIARVAFEGGSAIKPRVASLRPPGE